MSLVAAVSGVTMSAVWPLAAGTHLDVLGAEARGGAGPPQQPRGAGGELVHGGEAVDGLLALLAGHVTVWPWLDGVWMLGAAGRECEES